MPSSFDSLVLDPAVSESHTSADSDSLLVSLRGQIPYSGDPQKGEIEYSVGQIDSPQEHFNSVTSIANDNIFYFGALVRKIRDERKSFQEIVKSVQSDEKSFPHELLSSMGREVIINEIGIELQNEWRSSFHLPAIRGELGRIVDISNTTAENAERIGQETVSQLRRIVRKDPESHQFLLSHLLNVASIEAVDFEDDPQERTRVFAKYKETGAKVLIADLGFGVSQCLPILVKGVTMPSRSYLMVEQPEAQLHPTAQLELGSYFADLWTQRNVGSIIETHSSNILLRLRRLVARGDLSHKDVSVAFFSLDEERGNVPVIKNLDINEDGSMQAGLPMEFFAANIREGLQLGARA